MSESSPLTHTQRQGAILFLLLLGPAPIALVLFLVGTSPLALTGVLLALALLVISMLALYHRQRIVAGKQGLPRLPAWQVISLLGLIGAIAGATFLLPQPETAFWGGVCAVVAAGLIFAVGHLVRREVKDLDERSAVLVLGLMALFIALANAGL